MEKHVLVPTTSAFILVCGAITAMPSRVPVVRCSQTSNKRNDSPLIRMALAGIGV
jgi:hypothetical protein